jgi:hypothetical protein
MMSESKAIGTRVDESLSMPNREELSSILYEGLN